MDPATANSQQMLDALAALRAEVSTLRERVATLEAAGAAAVAAPASAAAHAESISEDLVLTISAAIAAYLGVKPHIRQIRLLGSGSWAQQGRATIQASHAISVRHG